MTSPTPAQLDQAVIDAMRALAELRRADPQDPVAIEQGRQNLLAARAARGYAGA